MNTNCNSIGITKVIGQNLRLIGSTGEGDNRITLWRAANGREAIETNGDPVFETSEGFAEAREQILA